MPEAFEEKYYEEKYNYNPLHVGDVWQYSNGYEEIITKDTLIEGRTYYKREFPDAIDRNVYIWERNDSIKRAAYLWDIFDLDRDNVFKEELLLDSLMAPNFTEYFSFRKVTEFLEVIGDPPPYTARIKDSSWAIIFGDTVMARLVEYHCCFTEEIVADKFGVVWSMTEGPPYSLSGAIIDGKEYGKIVSVKKHSNFPVEFSLSQNYPNPFNPITTINYSLKTTGFVNLEVFNSLGQTVAVLVNGEKGPGIYKAKFNASGLASGIYLYRLSINSFLETKKMLLLK